MKLGKYTVPTGNRTLDGRVAVHYATTEPRKLHTLEINSQNNHCSQCTSGVAIFYYEGIPAYLIDHVIS